MADDDGILWDVVEEHLDESEFLWMQWERGLDAANLTASELADGAESRLFAHVDGLVLAAPEVIERLLKPALRDYQRDRAAAASWAWLMTGEPKALPTLCGPVLRECDAPERRGVIRAVGLWDGGDVPALLAPALAAAESEVLAAALEILAARGLSSGPWLAELAGARDPAVLAACIDFAVPAALAPALAGELGEPAFDRALRAGLMRHVPGAWEAALARLERRSAAAAVGGLGGEAGLVALLAALAEPRRCAGALFGLGFTGRRAAADACVARLEDPELGALAAEAFEAITGFDPGLARGAQAQAEPEEDEEEESAEDVDAGLDRVDGETVRTWWQAERKRFEAGRRYVLGEPATAESFAAAFERMAMRRRHWLALELAARTRGRLVVNTREWIGQQRRALVGLPRMRVELERPVFGPGA